MNDGVPALGLALVTLSLAGCAGDPAAACDDGPGIHVALEKPTKDPALYWVVELRQDETELEERDGSDGACVTFDVAPGTYWVVSTYWIDGTDCWYEDARRVYHEARTVRVLDDHERHCEA